MYCDFGFAYVLGSRFCLCIGISVLPMYGISVYLPMYCDLGFAYVNAISVLPMYSDLGFAYVMGSRFCLCMAISVLPMYCDLGFAYV